jgi:hypothetical protein
MGGTKPKTKTKPNFTHVQVCVTYHTRFMSNKQRASQRLAEVYASEYPKAAELAHFVMLPWEEGPRSPARTIAFGSAEDLPGLLRGKLCLLDIVAEPNLRGRGSTLTSLDGVGSVQVAHSMVNASRGRRPTRVYQVKLLREELSTALDGLVIGKNNG